MHAIPFLEIPFASLSTLKELVYWPIIQIYFWFTWWIMQLCYADYRPCVYTLRPRQNGRHFPDDICKCIFLNENAYISIKISLKFVPKARINNVPALVQIMAWRRPVDKPLSEPMMVSLLTHICVYGVRWWTRHLYLTCRVKCRLVTNWPNYPCLWLTKYNTTVPILMIYISFARNKGWHVGFWRL